MTEEQLAEKKRKNDKFFIGYFSWYWTKAGSFWSAWKAFFGDYLMVAVRHKIFFSIGFALGTMICRLLFMPYMPESVQRLFAIKFKK